jgi:hypothetical protein
MKLKFVGKELSLIGRYLGRPLKKDELDALIWSYDSFAYFTYTVYRWAVAKHFEGFTGGQFILDECEFLQAHDKTITVEPRAHWKSMRLYAYLMWRLWKNRYDNKNVRTSYFSYRKTLAEEHVQTFKYLVGDSFFSDFGLIDEKGRADTIARFTWNSNRPVSDRKRFMIKPYGLLEFSRGTHTEIVLVDDPLKDDSDPNARTNVWRINSIFVSVVMNIPTADGVLHVVGTPQTQDDFLFDLNIQKEFTVRIRPAIYKEDGVEKALWPEMFPLERLLKMRESRKIKLKGGVVSTFEQEFMCQPRSAAFSYFEAELMRKCIDISLHNNDYSTIGITWRPFPGRYSIAGYDPGKRVDPGHFIVLEIYGGHYTQLLSKWFDHIDYSSSGEIGYSQFSYITKAKERLHIGSILADNTRGELTTAEEQKLIPGLICVPITPKKKMEMAQAVDSAMMDGVLHLIDDPRQTRQLMGIQQDLTCAHTSEGHGEPLTSLGLPLSTIYYKQGLIGAKRGSYLMRMH